jgi:large subunit ribosomal protein L29
MANRHSKFKKEIQGLNLKELQAKAKDIESQLFQLRMQFKTGQLGSTAVLGLVRKELARVKTAMTQKGSA